MNDGRLRVRFDRSLSEPVTQKECVPDWKLRSSQCEIEAGLGTCAHEGEPRVAGKLAYGRVIPNALMRDARVVGFMPSNAAAPSAPKSFPLVKPSAWTMFSRSWRLRSSLVAGRGEGLPRKDSRPLYQRGSHAARAPCGVRCRCVRPAWSD